MGERISNLRQLLRRMTISRVLTNPADLADWFIDSGVIMHRLPMAYGYDTIGGVDSAKGIIATTSNFSFNWCNFHPITYVISAFIGTRGSIHWTFNNDNSVPSGLVYACRYIGSTGSSAGYYSDTGTYGTASNNRSKFITGPHANPGTGGMAITNQFTNSGLNISLPNYNIYRFATTNPLRPTNVTSSDYSTYEMIQMGIQYNGTDSAFPKASNSKVFCLAGIGTDFTCHFFLNVPTLWKYSSIPTPN